MKSSLNYDPNSLLDAVKRLLKIRNDAALCRALGIAHPTLTKIRRFDAFIGASLLITMHELTGLEIIDLRILMGDRRPRFTFIRIEKAIKSKKIVSIGESITQYTASVG